MSSAEMSTKATDVPSSGLPALAAAAASGHRGGLMHLPASPSTPHVPAPAAAGEAADAEPVAPAAAAVDAAAIAAQCRYDDAAAEYKAKIGTGEATAFKELKNEAYAIKNEAYAILQSANENLSTFRSDPDAVMSSSRKLESHEVTIPAGVRKRQKLGTLRSCLIGV